MAAARAQLTADSPSTPGFFTPGRWRLVTVVCTVTCLLL